MNFIKQFSLADFLLLDFFDVGDSAAGLFSSWTNEQASHPSDHCAAHRFELVSSPHQRKPIFGKDNIRFPMTRATRISSGCEQFLLWQDGLSSFKERYTKLDKKKSKISKLF